MEIAVGGGEHAAGDQSTILIVDDDADMSQVLCDVLRSEGGTCQRE